MDHNIDLNYRRKIRPVSSRQQKYVLISDTTCYHTVLLVFKTVSHLIDSSRLLAKAYLFSLIHLALLYSSLPKGCQNPSISIGSVSSLEKYGTLIQGIDVIIVQ